MTRILDSPSFVVGAAQVQLRNVCLRPDVIVDEIRLDGGDIQITAQGDGAGAVGVRAGETKFQLMMSEPHINTLLETAIPADAPVRNLRIAVLSGKIRIAGQVVKSVLHLPFTLEAIPLIENGMRVRLDCQGAKLGAGLGLPAVVVELIEQYINNNPALPLNLSQMPIPVRLDEIKCEPGRLNVLGRAKLQWPLAVMRPAIAPFSPREAPAPLLPQDKEAEEKEPAMDTEPAALPWSPASAQQS